MKTTRGAATGLAPTTAAQAEEFEMETFLGATASTTVAFEKMAAGLAGATDGEVEITILPGGAVVGAGETIEAIRNGLLDGRYTAPSSFAGKDPAMGVLGDMLATYSDSPTRTAGPPRAAGWNWPARSVRRPACASSPRPTGRRSGSRPRPRSPAWPTWRG